MIKLSRILPIITFFFIFNGCTSEFDELNFNENVPTSSSPRALLPSIIFEPINPHLELQAWLTNQIMHYYVRRNDNQLDYYDFASGDNYFRSVWSAIYTAIWNANDMIGMASADGLNAYQAAGKIMRAYYLATSTELWIDVPASEAGLGAENITPAYDPQKDTYITVLEDLKEANTLLADNAVFTDGGDVLFAGEVLKWRKLANSLRLRYLLRLSNRAEINSADEIAEIVGDSETYPIITSNEDAGFYKFSGTSPDVSDFALQIESDFQSISMSLRMEEVYEIYDDPRMDFFFSKPDNTDDYPNHEGIQNGLTREEAQKTNGYAEENTSRFTTVFVNNPSLLYYTIISHTEVQFILAESALNGWIAGDPSDYYNAAITANFDQWGIEMPDGFLSLPEVAFDGTLKRLMEQKWLGFFFNNTVESWGEYKRTGLPELEIGPAAYLKTNGIFPTRIFYPTLEQSINSENYTKAKNSIGGDIITAKHWYQN